MKFTLSDYKKMGGRLSLDDLPYDPSTEDALLFLNSLPVPIQYQVMLHGPNDSVVRDTIFEYILHKLGFRSNTEYYSSDLFSQYARDRKNLTSEHWRSVVCCDAKLDDSLLHSSLIDYVFEVSDRIKDNRTSYSIFTHMTAEMGELADEINIAEGFRKAPPGSDGIVGETVDVILCGLDLIRKNHPKITREDLMKIIIAKCIKWEKDEPKCGYEQ